MPSFYWNRPVQSMRRACDHTEVSTRITARPPGGGIIQFLFGSPQGGEPLGAFPGNQGLTELTRVSLTPENCQNQLQGRILKRHAFILL